MKEVGSKMQTILENLNLGVLKNELPIENTMTSSELRNNAKWRSLLEKYQTVTITTNGKIVAQLNRPDLVPSLVSRIKELELELEQRKVERLYGDRIENTDQSKLLSGDKSK